MAARELTATHSFIDERSQRGILAAFRGTNGALQR
jgi:hypothetical protein